MTDATDIAIVGAGPAGMAAADILGRHDLRVTIIDEQQRAGGQFLRQPPRSFTVDNWLQGRLYTRAKRTLEHMEGNVDVDWRLATTALGIFPSRESGFDVRLQDKDGPGSLNARHVILAGGCREAPLSFPGWTLPGVMGTGAIQTLLKSQQVLAGENIMLCGSHPLQLIVAGQILDAGGRVMAVTFTQPRSHILKILRHPGLFLRNWPQLAATAAVLTRLFRANVPVLFATTPVQATGEDRIAHVQTCPVSHDGTPDPGRIKTWDTDCLGLCFGFQASSELARQAGAATHWDADNGGWLVNHDPWMRSSMPGLSVAGELTGQFGADAAIDKGIIAAAGILMDLGRIDHDSASRMSGPPRKRLRDQERFARTLNALAAPPTGLACALPDDETVICRCEGLTRAHINHALADAGPVQSADAIKLFSRAGMGLCQGRTCYHQVARMISDRTGDDMETIGPFQASYPVKPVAIGASITKTR